MSDITVDHSPSRAVSTPVPVSLILREEANMVALSDHNESYGGLDIELLTRI
jgi:hypothetical protein